MTSPYPDNAALIQGKPVSTTAPTNGQLLAYNTVTGQIEWTTDPGASLSNPVTAAQGGLGADASGFTGVIQAAGGAFSASLTPTLSGITGTGALSITRAAPAAAANAAAIGVTGADGGAGTAGVAASGTWTLQATDAYTIGSTITFTDANGHTQQFQFAAAGAFMAGNPYSLGMVGFGGSATVTAELINDIFNGTNTSGFGVQPACTLLMSSVRVGTTCTLTDTGTGTAGNSAITDSGNLPGGSAANHSSTMSGGVNAVTGGNGTTITVQAGGAGSNGGSAGSIVLKVGSTTIATLTSSGITYANPTTIAGGGTNSATALNSNRVMVSSAGAIVELGALTNGQLVIGSTSAAPVAATPTGSGGVTVTLGAGSLAIGLSAVPNAALTNSSVTVNTAGALTGGGAVALGGTLSLAITASDATHVGTMSTAQASQLAALPTQILSGTDTLSSGTKTITAPITANSRIVVTIKDANPGAGSLTVGLEVPNGSRTAGTSFVVRANVAAGTINTLDTSTFDWIAVG